MLQKRKKMIVNGHEFWNSEWEFDYEVSEELLTEVELWLRENLIFQKKMNYDHTSYGIKHIVERCIGKYVCNVDVKIAMARMGIKGKLKNKRSCNYSYPIHEHFFNYYNFTQHGENFYHNYPTIMRKIKRYLELKEKPEYRVLKKEEEKC